MTEPGTPLSAQHDDAQLAALGYQSELTRSMGLWSNMALGFTYLSPLVGVYSLFAYSLSIGGPPSIWWLVIVGLGQLLVALVFGEVVSQYPLAGGIYPWTRRLWNRRYAWIVSWIYIWAIIVTVTAVAEFGSGFVAALFGLEAPTPASGSYWSSGCWSSPVGLNYSGTRMLGRMARIGLAAELIGVIALGLYLLLFQREQPFSIFFDPWAPAATSPTVSTFLAASLVRPVPVLRVRGLRRRRRGGRGPDPADPEGDDPDDPGRWRLRAACPTPGTCSPHRTCRPSSTARTRTRSPRSSRTRSGTRGSKVFLVVTVTAFISCVLSLQAAGSRLLYAFARDRMLPGSRWLARTSPSSTRCRPTRCSSSAVVPIIIALFVFWRPDSLARVTAFAVLRYLRRLPGRRACGAASAAEGLAAGRAVEPRPLGHASSTSWHWPTASSRSSCCCSRPEADAFMDRWIICDRPRYRERHRPAVPVHRPARPSLRRTCPRGTQSRSPHGCVVFGPRPLSLHQQARRPWGLPSADHRSSARPPSLHTRSGGGLVCHRGRCPDGGSMPRPEAAVQAPSRV